MRKTLLPLAALASFAALATVASLTLPAAAEPDQSSCGAGTATTADPGPLNLDAVPVEANPGTHSVRGGCGDDEDDNESEGDDD